ncbi:MAG: trypsin-like peptidase domain-containing protein [Acidobacteria bacterium]|nr:trypsin-like peptidase domain-containing protein [Acidobacteriota bacterium]MCI0624208.1 trypsin-like peptidase domain-containing protein [Acidobacteriota bacterium]MCI0724715.1 trypsin-like peptidase domain-containing protein [Acidobacteriota bacterium]
MITLRLRTFVLILGLAGLSAWAAGRLLTRYFPPEPFFTEGPSAAAADKPYLPATQDEANSIEIYQRVSPAVVNITSTTVDFDFFFNAMPKQGSGSGAIIDRQGHILTNYHVVEGARTLEVTLSDKRKVKAKIIGADPSNDLAVIQIEPGGKPLSIVRLGSSSNLQVGQKVLAIGNPFGLEGTLTTGVISSLRRSIRAENGKLIDDVIQTDAAINPGNSGGPLLNAYGELIGINSQIFSTSGGNIGIGFAVPVNTAKTIIPDLISEGRVRRAYARLSGYELTPELAEALELSVNHGILVARTQPDDSFAQAGIRGGRQTYLVGNSLMILGGDIIVEADGQPIRTMAELDRVIEKKRPGDVVNVKIYRQGRETAVRVTLIERTRPGQFL